MNGFLNQAQKTIPRPQTSSEQSSQNLKSYLQVNQIHKLLHELNKKKSELKEYKLQQQHLNQRTAVKQHELAKLRIQMDHQISKESEVMQKKNKLHKSTQQIDFEIKQLRKKASLLKSQVNRVFQQISISKKEREDIAQQLEKCQFSIKWKKLENDQFQQRIQRIDTKITSSQNDMRCKRQKQKKILIRESELTSLHNLIQEKNAKIRKQSKQLCSTEKEMMKDIYHKTQKIKNHKKQILQIHKQNQNMSFQNDKICQLNKNILVDLQNAQKHLKSIKKTNGLLKKSLETFDQTSETISKLITH